jgi:hypothetical protein
MAERVYLDARAALRLTSADLDPAEVTARLRLQPDHTHRRGEPYLSHVRPGRIAVYASFPRGLWLMSSGGRVQSPRLAAHLDWLLRELEPRADEVRALIASGIGGDIYCWSCGWTRRAPAISRRLRERAAALGLAIVVDHHLELEPDAAARDEDGGGADSR